MLPASFENEYYGLKTVNRCKQDNGDKWELTTAGSDEIDKVSEVDDRCRKDESSEEIDEHDEPHTETTKSAHIVQ